MPEIEITVKQVFAAKTGKKYGAVLSSEEQKFLAKPGLLTQFGRGQVCKVAYHTETWGQDEVNVLDSKLTGGLPPVSTTFRSETSPKDSKQIFVTALLKEMVSEADGRDSVLAKGKMLKAVYDELFGTPAKQTTQNLMNDSIPDEF